jgi:hypothetical protein
MAIFSKTALTIFINFQLFMEISALNGTAWVIIQGNIGMRTKDPNAYPTHTRSSLHQRKTMAYQATIDFISMIASRSIAYEKVRAVS